LFFSIITTRHEQGFIMSNVCQVTGKRPTTGFSVSHSHHRTKRWFKPNIQKQRFWVPNEKRWVTLTVSTKGIKTINKNGIESVMADMRRRGVKI
jgi:large subunit ribosomal protein L28